jgi:hypothetical protein
VRPLLPHESLRPLYRVIGGVRWRNYCSRACSCRAAHAKRRGNLWQPMVAQNRAQYIARTKARLLEDAEAYVGRVLSLSELLKFAWRCEKRGYARGYSAAWMAKRRKGAA